MRALDPAFAAHVENGATTLATCWRVTRADGLVLGFTDHDRTLTFDGVDHKPDAGGEGSRFAASADLSVDNAEVAGILSDDALTAADLVAGRYDGARVDVWRVNWAKPDERALVKSATIGEVAREGARFVAELRGPAHALARATGRVYQRQCDARLGDARCGVDAASAAYVGAGTVASAADEARFTASGLAAFDDGWFAHGRLTWTSGASAGLEAHVKSHTVGEGGARLDLWLPSPAPIAAGDAFEVVAGCDRRAATCAGKFANLINFRGFHLMPGNDFAVSYPRAADENDGGKR